MPARRLTDAVIRALTPNSRQTDYWCTDVRGFGIRLSPGGRRSFMVRYRLSGRYRRQPLGVYPQTSLADARRHARKVIGLVAAGQDPAHDRQNARHADTFGDLAELYLKRHAAQKASGHEDRRIIGNELLPRWQWTRATDISRRDVRELVEAIAARPAPVMANRVQAVISTMFNVAMRYDIVDATGIDRLFGLIEQASRIIV